MSKQMIEIDVPDGYEFEKLCQFGGFGDASSFTQTCTLVFKKKEPEYIEVRDYLALDFRGKPIKMTLNADDFEWSERLESDSDFIRWIDKDPRKVEI